MKESQSNSRNQDGIEDSKPKRINAYRGGAAPKPRKMNVDDAISAANAVVDRCSQQVKDTKSLFDAEVEEAKRIINDFNSAANDIPTWIPAKLDEKSQASVDKLQKSIDTADFTRQIKNGFDKATMGRLGEHKAAAWAVLITSVLLCVAFAMLAIQTSVSKGRAEEQAEQYKADAMNWRQFQTDNPKTAAKFLKQKEQP